MRDPRTGLLILGVFGLVIFLVNSCMKFEANEALQEKMAWDGAALHQIAGRIVTPSYDIYPFVGSDSALVVKYVPRMGRDSVVTALKFLPDIYGQGSQKMRIWINGRQYWGQYADGSGMMIVDRRDFGK